MQNRVMIPVMLTTLIDDLLQFPRSIYFGTYDLPECIYLCFVWSTPYEGNHEVKVRAMSVESPW